MRERWGHPPWSASMPPPLYKNLLLHSHTSSRRISLPPLEFPHGLGSARYMFPVAFSRRICCFRCFAGARAWRLSGYPDVCAITDAPLLAVLDVMVLDQMDFITILRSASVRLHH